MRVGWGYDAHPWDASRPLVLCGVTIPGHPGLAGHSDGDAACHALVDALLGAAAAGDIGRWFPPGDPRWRGASSLAMLRQVAAWLSAAGWRIENVDLTLIAARPSLAGRREAFVGALSEALGVDPERVSVKAASGNGLGFAGEGRGLAAVAVAALEPPGPETAGRGLDPAGPAPRPR
ncbi:MAG: 2-C-methyl-D-erythritol 2,4-cyclodiphosphate synthase [Bacillota bacterium]|nr:2-C-methyl-D-erythritol 2,4-cyclodiphosphate synthase [Bacillota bacterium]